MLLISSALICGRREITPSDLKMLGLTGSTSCIVSQLLGGKGNGRVGVGGTHVLPNSTWNN